MARKLTISTVASALFDFGLALLLVGPATLVSLIAMVFVRIETKGSPLLIQTRVGRDQKLFKILKIRSMFSDTQLAGTHEVPKSNVTKVGAVLRKTRIDELPQIWNVLLGQMKFVGPRPCLPSQKELIAEREKRGVFEVCPGITGVAQVAGITMATPEKLAIADRNYISKKSFVSDLTIITETVFGIFRP